MASQLYAAQTPEDFQKLSQRHGGLQRLAQLGEAERNMPASRWTLRHLLGFRLLTLPEKPFLDILKLDHEECPACDPVGSRAFELDRYWVDQLMDTPRHMSQSKDAELLRLPGGFFFVALARAACADSSPGARDHPSRDRRPPQIDGYINSSSAIDGSSSPTQPSGSEYEIDAHDIDEDDYESRRSKPEDVTLILLICFLQFALNLCLVQDPTQPIEVRPRVERRISTAQIAGQNMRAEDDGGICRMRRKRSVWQMRHPYLALLEAKRASQSIYLDKTGRLIPKVSNNILAQYLGEAVTAWKANRNFLEHDVFLIAGTSTFIRFIHFKFNADYEEYVNAESDKSQRAVINREGSDVFVYMQCTRWFSLQSPEGRKSALCNILALVQWQASQGAQDLDEMDDSSGDDIGGTSMDDGDD